jgi:hypothetical protein
MIPYEFRKRADGHVRVYPAGQPAEAGFDERVAPWQVPDDLEPLLRDPVVCGRAVEAFSSGREGRNVEICADEDVQWLVGLAYDAGKAYSPTA